MSTTAIETCALLPSGWRIAARATFACCAACEMIVFTSAAVSEFAVTVGLAMKGKKCVSTSPAMPPTTAGQIATSVHRELETVDRWRPAEFPNRDGVGFGACLRSGKRVEFRRRECYRRELMKELQSLASLTPRLLLRLADRSPSDRDRLYRRHRLLCRRRRRLRHSCKSARCPDRR